MLRGNSKESPTLEGLDTERGGQVEVVMTGRPVAARKD